MLARMQWNRNPHTLLVGMQIRTTIMESSMEIPQMIKAKAHKGGMRIVKTPKKLASICCP
jgi:hypothetical protein